MGLGDHGQPAAIAGGEISAGNAIEREWKIVRPEHHTGPMGAKCERMLALVSMTARARNPRALRPRPGATASWCAAAQHP